MRALEKALARIPTDGAPEGALRTRAELVMAEVGRLGVAVLVATDNARYVDVNDGAIVLTGYTRPELLRMFVWDLTPAPRKALGRRLWRDFLARGRMTGRYAIKRKDGAVVSARYLALAHVLPGIHVSALSASRRTLERAKPAATESTPRLRVAPGPRRRPSS